MKGQIATLVAQQQAAQQAAQHWAFLQRVSSSNPATNLEPAGGGWSSDRGRGRPRASSGVPTCRGGESPGVGFGLLGADPVVVVPSRSRDPSHRPRHSTTPYPTLRSTVSSRATCSSGWRARRGVPHRHVRRGRRRDRCPLHRYGRPNPADLEQRSRRRRSALAPDDLGCRATHSTPAPRVL